MQFRWGSCRCSCILHVCSMQLMCAWSHKNWWMKCNHHKSCAGFLGELLRWIMFCVFFCGLNAALQRRKGVEKWVFAGALRGAALSVWMRTEWVMLTRLLGERGRSIYNVLGKSGDRYEKCFWITDFKVEVPVRTLNLVSKWLCSRYLTRFLQVSLILLESENG